jgi:hypothetical protein
MDELGYKVRPWQVLLPPYHQGQIVEISRQAHVYISEELTWNHEVTAVLGALI